MCGICGIASLSRAPATEPTRRRVHAMVEALAHRGPDDWGEAESDAAVLGATRLAIRGIHSGKQPMVDPDTGVVAVCNGEIDNHRELCQWLEARGRPAGFEADVSVIPGLYLELGEAFVERLVGPFALAVWDPRTQQLLLARDRAGERPMFFTVSDRLVSFATEIAALAPSSEPTLTLDRRALQAYLQFGIFAAPATPFVEIQKVAPSEVVTIGADGVRRRRYWRWNIASVPKRAPSLDSFDTIFREAVRRQSDVDVNYGVFLSGGLDSSLVAAVAKQLRPEHRLTAYTIRFDEPSYDEGTYAEWVARQLGLDSVTVRVTPEDFPRELTSLIRLVGEPLGDPAWIPTALLARRAAQDAKLALVGEGGDELFGGYPTYLGAHWAQAYGRLPQPIKRAVGSAVRRWPASDKKVTVSFLLKRFVEAAEMDGLTRHHAWRANTPPRTLQRFGVELPAPPKADLAAELLGVAQQDDLETSLAEGLLTKADRASMVAAFELRAPFLDMAVMDFAATLPVAERVRGVTTKVFLKRYAESYLPRAIVHRRKRGLSVPLSQWLRGPLYGWAADRLSSRLLGKADICARTATELLDEHRHRKADHARALWTLLVLVEWLIWASEQTSPLIRGFRRAAASIASEVDK